MYPVMQLKSLILSALLPFGVGSTTTVLAQAKSTVYLTSMIGQLNPVGDFGEAYQSSLSVTTGIEARIKKSDFYVIGSIEYNSVGYSQKVRDQNTQFLIQNTTTPILLISANFGKAFYFNAKRRFFVSPYVGTGFINVSEPRVNIDALPLTATIETAYSSGAFGRVGTRLGFNTGKVWLPTVLLDSSYWRSFNNPYEGQPAQAYTLMIGTRYGF